VREPFVRAVGRTVGRALPRGWRLHVSSARASLLSARTRMRLRRLAASGQVIVAGPYFGEVGFELLYWIPFLAWFTERYGISPDRLIAVSRGGAASWYSHLASRYCDVFEVMEPAEFRARNERRIRELGEQKQIAVTGLDEEIAAAVQRKMGAEAAVLHPSMMYALFAPFWWGHLPIDWVARHTRFRRLTPPAVPPHVMLPREFAAVKFYFNDCFVDAPGLRRFVHEVVDEVSRHLPVVSLSTGLAIDDHDACEPHHAVPVIQPGYEAKTNLDVQTAIVARARRFVGTYGGFSYLSPFFGVPATAYYSDASGYSVRHLEVAQLGIARMGGGSLLELRPAHGVAANAREGGLACSSR
jgi:hypothetical protein